MSGPYLPDHGECPTEVTVTRDGDVVVVCGVRLTEVEAQTFGCHVLSLAAEVRRERVAREQRARQEAEERAWTAGAVAVVEVSGTSLRLVPSGRVESRGDARVYRIDAAIEALLAAVPGWHVWFEGSSVWHVRGCGCDVFAGLGNVRLMPGDWRPAERKPVCKRSLRKLAAEVTP